MKKLKTLLSLVIATSLTSMFWPSDTSLPLSQPYALEGEYEIVE